MRWSVEMVIDLLGSGISNEEIIQDHPEQKKMIFQLFLKFAKMYLSGQTNQNVA